MKTILLKSVFYMNSGKMMSKVFGLLVLAAVATLGSAQMTQIFLEDESITHISNPLIGRAISIPKFTFDRLQSCLVVFPNGALIEAFPDNQLDDPYVSFSSAVEPFNACSIGFVGAPPSYSGTYELYSVVEDWATAELSLTRKKFHLTFIMSEVVFPTDAKQ